jgi:hypothetical protein
LGDWLELPTFIARSFGYVDGPFDLATEKWLGGSYPRSNSLAARAQQLDNNLISNVLLTIKYRLNELRHQKH